MTAIEKAVQAALNAGCRTADLAKDGETVSGTAEVGDLVCRAIAGDLG